MDTRILGMTIHGAELRIAKTHPPSPSAFGAKPAELAHTSGTGMLQLAHEQGISEQVRHDWLKRSDGDGRARPAR